MKILTMLGTRPELIRLSVLLKKLDVIVDHVFVYINQNYDYTLSGQFFKELFIRKPDYYFDNKGHSIGSFLANAIIQFEEVILKEKPDKMLVLGDTDSGLLSLIAEKYSIPIYHMEAGNRCFSDLVPEEMNRRLIDCLSTYNLPYTENSKQNLLSEGFHKNYVFKTGNPIYEVLNSYKVGIDQSNILSDLDLNSKKFVLVTTHRAENVDNFESLNNIINAINKISDSYRVIFSVHPRTKAKLIEFNIGMGINVVMSEPFGFFDFIKLEQFAKVIITDSGTCSEEASIFKVPSITIRNSTERQELIECGSTILAGTETGNIIQAFNHIVNTQCNWTPPNDYMVENVSDIVINILLGK